MNLSVHRNICRYTFFTFIMLSGLFLPNICLGKELTVNVEKINGVPMFTVNGTPTLTPCFETYHPEYRYFQQFADTGVTLFSFNTNVAACDYGHSKPTWLGYDFYDYSEFDERASRVLKANPNALLMPRINLGVPRWWMMKNPDELQVLDNGSTAYSKYMPTHYTRRVVPSLASKKWKEDLGDALRRFLDHVEQSPYADHIFGYFLAGLHTEEWYHWSAGYDELSDYNPQMRTAFAEWLRRKYSSNKALQASWNNHDITFDSVTIPTKAERKGNRQKTFRNPEKEMNVIDFYLFYNDIVPETIDYFAGIIKEQTNRTKVIGGFYAYMYEFRGNPEYGHNAFEKYNESDNLDFVFVTASYGNRTLGVGGDYQRAPAFSAMLHGKLWYHDNDVMSFLAPQVLAHPKSALYGFKPEDVPHLLEVLAVTENLEETRQMYRRSMGFALANGYFESYFDLHGGYYDHPDLMEEVSRLNRVAQTAEKLDRSSISEILIISDEASCSYATFANRMLGTSLSLTQQKLIKIGAPADHILINDLDLLDSSPYKLIVFLNNYNMTHTQRQLVREKLMKDNKYLLWCYAPGYFNENKTSIEAMKDITGMHIIPSQDESLIAPQMELIASDSILGSALKKTNLHQIGPDGKMCRLFSVKDSDAIPLAVLPGTQEVTFASKDMGQWVSLYAISPTLPSSVYREIARVAGVHLFNNQDDTFYANKSIICIHANGDGTRTIELPEKMNITDMMTQKKIAGIKTYTCDLEHGQTLILKYVP